MPRELLERLKAERPDALAAGQVRWQLTRVARGGITRLVINAPPRLMESITVSVAVSAWTLGRDPT